MVDSVTPASNIDDACWNVTSSLERNPHFLSLKLAEESAWQLVKNETMELVTINVSNNFHLVFKHQLTCVCGSTLAWYTCWTYNLQCANSIWKSNYLRSNHWTILRAC